MAIPLAVIAAIGAGLGAIQAAQKQKAEHAARKEQILLNRYSPIFGQSPVAVGPARNHMLGGILGGAMTGYSMGALQPKSDGGEGGGTGLASFFGLGDGETAEPDYMSDEMNQIIPDAPGDNLGSNARMQIMAPFVNQLFQPRTNPYA